MGAHYGKGERLIARVLSAFPGIKAIAKRNYQHLNAMLYRKSYNFKSDLDVHVLPVEGETFYGYYDHSPESEDKRLILFHVSDSHKTKRLPDPRRPIAVGVYDTEEAKVIYKKATVAYNWQQGARLHWIGPRRFVFNNYSESKGYYSTLVNLEGSEVTETEIPLPIYDALSEVALTLNFARLHQMRPDYGYRNHSLTDLPPYDEDGVFIIDLITQKYKLLVSLSTLCQLEPNGLMAEAVHKVNHIMIAPDGKSFIFLHRYFVSGRRFDRLIVSDMQGSNLKVLADDEMVSHCCWLSSTEIIAYLRDYKQGDRYYKLNALNGSKRVVGEGIIDGFGDGHPTFKDSHLIIDTYPNKSRMKGLYQFDIMSNKLRQLGEFYESMNFYGETRCDLHPRLNYSGNRVYFDSVHSGQRKLYWMDL